MKTTEFDRDVILNGFLTDYLDGKLMSAEKNSFEDYLKENPAEAEFARKAAWGKKVLETYRKRMKRLKDSDLVEC